MYERGEAVERHELRRQVGPAVTSYAAQVIDPSWSQAYNAVHYVIGEEGHEYQGPKLQAQLDRLNLGMESMGSIITESIMDDQMGGDGTWTPDIVVRELQGLRVELENTGGSGARKAAELVRQLEASLGREQVRRSLYGQ